MSAIRICLLKVTTVITQLASFTGLLIDIIIRRRSIMDPRMCDTKSLARSEA
jgi:hypothetical protein